MTAIWRIEGNERSALIEIGKLKIKYALEFKHRENFDFMITTYNTENTIENTLKVLDQVLSNVRTRKAISKPKDEPIPLTSDGIPQFIDNQRDLRRTVLSLHYTFSKANPMTFVLRPKIAQEVKLEVNSSELLAVFNYLADKRFIEHRTNVSSSITTAGIDEVEEGFPTLIKKNPTPFQDPPLYISIDDHSCPN
jgi:hypothetical protein